MPVGLVFLDFSARHRSGEMTYIPERRNKRIKEILPQKFELTFTRRRFTIYTLQANGLHIYFADMARTGAPRTEW